MQAMQDAVVAIAEREEGIARTLRIKVRAGEVPADVQHRALARADTLTRLASDLRVAVGLPGNRIR